jgi:hypothetical protein
MNEADGRTIWRTDVKTAGRWRRRPLQRCRVSSRRGQGSNGRRRCGNLRPELEHRIRGLPLEQLEALAEALLDFRGPADLAA